MAELKSWDVAAANNNDAAPDGAPEGMAPSAVNDVIRENMAVLARHKGDNDGSLDSGGSSNAYTLTPNGTYSAYTRGDTFTFEANHTNTGAVTLNVSSLGTKAVKYTSGDALIGGELQSGGVYRVFYDGTDFLLANPTVDPSAAYFDNANGRVGFGGETAPDEAVHSAANVKADAQLIGQSLSLNSVMVSTSLRRTYSPSTSAQDMFDISFPTQANAACRCMVTFEDANFANGSIVWELYLASTGSGTTLDGVTLVQEDKVRRASGSLTNYGTWAASISGNKVRLTHTGTVSSGSGNLTIVAEGRLLGVPIEEV